MLRCLVKLGGHVLGRVLHHSQRPALRHDDLHDLPSLERRGAVGVEGPDQTMTAHVTTVKTK